MSARTTALGTARERDAYWYACGYNDHRADNAPMIDAVAFADFAGHDADESNRTTFLASVQSQFLTFRFQNRDAS